MPPTIERKVLVVDDLPDTRLFIANLLASHGYRAIMAETRAEGLRKVTEDNPSVIIIDMMIPNEGGIKFYRDLKRNPRFQQIPVIMLSTIARNTFFKWHKTRSSDLEQSADMYLGLPPEAEELLLAVERLAQTDSAGRAAEPPAALPPLTGNRKSERTP